MFASETKNFLKPLNLIIMKRSIVIPAILLCAVAGCGEHKSPPAVDIITVDVTATYPKKDLILQDFMDVEYIPLETTDAFLCQGFTEAVGRDIIIVRNYVSDGDIFIFDRKTGKGLRKINRRGQGPGEYAQATEIVLDEERGEMFVQSYPERITWVYDLEGNFKRKFPFADSGYYIFTFNYDRYNLLCYKSYLPTDNEQSCHLLVSKQDGSITREIRIPFQRIKSPTLIMEKEDLHITPVYYLTIPGRDNWTLANTSSDTVYSYSSDHRLTPLMARTPSIQSMKPEVFLFPIAFTDRYYFIQTMKKEIDRSKMKGLPRTSLMYDRLEKALFECTVYNADYANRMPVDMLSKPVNSEIAVWKSLGAPELVVAYKNGILKGRLKEIAAGLDEEDNPVIMLVKHKK
jgi:hypothetical protein